MSQHPLYQPPEDDEDDRQINYVAVKQDTAERHGCLTLWLVVMMLVSLVAIFTWMTNSVTLIHLSSPLQVYIVLVALIAQFVCVIGIYNWYKLGVYGLVIALLISTILRPIDGQSAGVLFFTLFMIYVFIRPNWRYYKGPDWFGFV